jgi:hypothetical protein
VRVAVRPDLPDLMQRALLCQTDGKLAAAEVLYREALALAPANFDALHMLGVVRLQRGDAVEGARHVLAAIRAATVEYPPVYGNLALCLGAVARQDAVVQQLLDPARPALDDSPLHFSDDIPAFAAEPPLVSLVMPRGSDEGLATATLRSLGRQTHRRLEVVLGDGGEGAQLPGGIAALRAECAIPIRHVPGATPPAAPTLNECASHARGRYLGLLQAGDEFAADRIELMTRLLCASGSRWGFSGVHFMDERGRRLGYGDDARADALMRGLDTIHAARSVTAAFLQFNHAIAAGNLLVERRLWDELGGFRDDHPAPCQDFCVRASLLAAPAILFEPAYVHRLCGTGTGSGPGVSAGAVTERLQAQWRDEIRQRLKDRPETARRIFMLQYAREWRLIADGRARELESRKLVAMAENLLAATCPRG